jgi:hypothetical protein
MLPHSYQVPAALLLVAGGTVACFAGYRLFRAVLAIYGFILGAMITSSVMGISNTAGMVIAAIAGGLVGAAIFTFAYFVGIALVGAGCGAAIAHLGWAVWTRSASTPALVDPPAVLVVALSIVGAVGAMFLQRYVIVFATAFTGAWTLIIGVLALVGRGGAPRALAAGDVWILYPFSPGLGGTWLPVAWLVLGVIGSVVQLGVTGKKR